jgi:anaerobic ribonucleoside-triphosphate reductase activating protein
MRFTPNLKWNLTKLNLGYIHAPLTALGPGRRVGVWLCGCARNCPGCLSPEFADFKAGEALTATNLTRIVLDLAKKHRLSAVTISGGEPFARPRPLKTLVSGLRSGGIEDILVYTGYWAYDLTEEFPWIEKYISALVDGPFERQNPSKEIFRGSDNQSLNIFEYRDYFITRSYLNWKKVEKRQAQIVVDPDLRLRILGIPGPGDYDHLFEPFPTPPPEDEPTA